MLEIRDKMRTTYFWQTEVEPKIKARQAARDSMGVTPRSEADTPMSTRSLMATQSFNQGGASLAAFAAPYSSQGGEYMPESSSSNSSRENKKARATETHAME